MYAQDTKERLWLLPEGHQGPAAVFDPVRSSWNAFATCEAAYQAQAGIADFALRSRSEQPMARFGTARRVCFLSDDAHVHFFDGKIWKVWTVDEIVGHSPSEGPAVSDGPPFFDPAGDLCVNWRKKSWQWMPGSRWHGISYKPGPDDDWQHRSSVWPTTPPGSPFPHPDSIALDGPDTAWLTYKRQLYKVAFGRAVSEFAPETGQPFLDDRGLSGVLHDVQGSTFLETISTSHSELVLLPAIPAPDMQIKATITVPDTVRLVLATHARREHRFAWRLDGGAWSTAGSGSTLVLDFLPAGRHRVEARTLDMHLNFAPSPATAFFVIHADPAKQIAMLIRILRTGRDAAREKAIAKLCRFPVLAPSALFTARPGADADQQWWIDAALQELVARSGNAESGAR